MHKLKIFITLGCLLNTGALFAADIESIAISELRELAVENSLILKSDRWSLEQSADTLEVDLLDHAKIVTSSVTEKDLDSDENFDTVITVKADMDLTSKFNISAQTDTDQNTALGVTFSPFASDYVSAADYEQYQLAQLAYQYDYKNLLDELDRAVLTVTESELALELAKEQVTLTQAQEKSLRGSYALGVSTLSEVAQASQDSGSAQQELFTAQVDLLDAKQALYQLLGEDEDLPKISVDELIELVQYRSQQLLQLSINEIQSLQVEQAMIEYQTLTTEINDVDFYNPDLSFTGEYDITDNAVEIGASFSFSKSQFGRSSKLDLNQELQLKSSEIMQQETLLENNYHLLKQKLSLSETALETRLLEQALYEQDLNKVLLLQEQGERTSLQVEEQRYLKQAADRNVFSALVTLYLAQNDFAALWP